MWSTACHSGSPSAVVPPTPPKARRACRPAVRWNSSTAPTPTSPHCSRSSAGHPTHPGRYRRASRCCPASSPSIPRLRRRLPRATRVPLHQLAVAPADVSGTRLGLALNAPSPRPLASYQLEHPDGSVLRLGVLGASHVVTVEHATRQFSEQVSCTARTHGGTLPEHADAPGYRIESHTATHDEATFRRLAHELREHCTTGTGWLGGTFPGDDAALTVLAAEPDGTGWRWQTWHLYPQRPFGSGGVVIQTASRWQP